MLDATSNSSKADRSATLRQRREQAQQTRDAARRDRRDTGSFHQAGSGDPASNEFSQTSFGPNANSGSLQLPNNNSSLTSNPNSRRHHQQQSQHKNLGDKPLLDAVYSTSLRTLGHSIDGRVIFTSSLLPGLGLTSLRPVASLGSQLQRLVLDNNALESLEDLQGCVSLVHFSAIGNKLTHAGAFPHLVASSNTLNYLNLSDNKITSLQGVERLRFLVTLTLDGNQLTTLEVDGADEQQLHQSANESCNAHCSAMLDDVIKAIDDTIKASKPAPRSRRSSMHESFTSSGSRDLLVSQRSAVAGLAKSRSLQFRGVKTVADEDDHESQQAASPLRFLVSLWRFSAANNDIKDVRPSVFERCPLRLLNLSNNQLCDLDFVLPLHKTLMVLTLDGNDISHLPASTSGHSSSSGGAIRRSGSRHLGDGSAHKSAHHHEVSHLNFQMMTTLVSLNLARNNLASFTEISELRHLPQLRHLTLAQCTLCSLPTAADLNVRDDALKKKRVDGVRNDHDLGRSTLDPTSATADRIAGSMAARQSGGGAEDNFQSGVFGTRTDTTLNASGGVASTSSRNSRKHSMVVITSPSMHEFATCSEEQATNSFAPSGFAASQSFKVEALIRPDDAESVTYRTPEEQDATEFSKRSTEERYRLKVLMHVPQLQTLDGVPCTTEDIAEAQQLAGGHLREERTRAIAKYIKPASGSAGAALRKMINNVNG